jgi:hypothetical protein
VRRRSPVSELESELSRLRTENVILKMEREILKKATAFFAKQYPIRLLYRVLKVSVSGFHDYLQRQDRPDPDSATNG